MTSGPINEVPDDQKVIHETGASDDAHLIVDPAAEFGGACLADTGDFFICPSFRTVVVDAVALQQSFLDDIKQVGAIRPHRFALILGDGEFAFLFSGDEQAVLKLFVAVKDGVDLLVGLGLDAFAEDIDWVVVLTDGQFDVAHLGDRHRILDGIGDFAEDP